MFDVLYMPQEHAQIQIQLQSTEEILLEMQIDPFFLDGWVYKIKERIDEVYEAEKEKVLYQV